MRPSLPLHLEPLEPRAFFCASNPIDNPFDLPRTPLASTKRRKSAKPAPVPTPNHLKAAVLSPGEVRLRWDKLKTKKTPWFSISRSIDGKHWHLVGSVRRGTFAFLDIRLEEDQTYYYRVRANLGDRRSPFSSAVRVAIPPSDPAPRPDDRPTDPPIPPFPNEPSTGAFPQGALDHALKQPLVRYSRRFAGGAYTDQPASGDAPLILAAAAFAGDTRADDRLLQQMRFTITPGNEILANGGYPSQHERRVTAMYAVARQIPRIWDSLTPDETHRIDLLMQASLVASAFTTSDHNPYVLAGTQQYTLDGDDNVNRDWNPNYREGMLGGLLVAMAYFGGSDNASTLLDTYDHGAFVTQLREAGMENLVSTFDYRRANPDSDAPTGAMIERAVADYRYYNDSLADYLSLYGHLVVHTFGAVVSPGLNDGKGLRGAGRVLSGADQLPNVGSPGMLLEFDSSDAFGPRSSAVYAYDGLRTHLANHFVLVASGFWDESSPIATTAVRRLRIGGTDLWYKLEQGYADYQKGAYTGTTRLTDSHRGFAMIRPFWQHVLRIYHDRA